MPTDIIQWFPGHMAKTKRLIRENLGAVDIVIELLDARIPYSSANPQLAELIGQKPVITVLNKATLADEKASIMWRDHYIKSGRRCIVCDCIKGAGLGILKDGISKVLADKLARYEEKGMNGRHIKAMIVGIPNVGKSSLINKLSKGKSAKVENRPGVTLTKQWVTTSIGIDLLDMPGVLWPKFDSRTVGENLAATGAIKDDVVIPEQIAASLCEKLAKRYPALLCQRYKLTEEKLAECRDGEAIMELICRKRGFLLAGGVLDTERGAGVILEEFRNGKIGRITLERPEDTFI